MQLSASLMHPIPPSLGVLRLRTNYKGKMVYSFGFREALYSRQSVTVRNSNLTQNHFIPASSSHTIPRDNSPVGKGACFFCFEPCVETALHLQRMWKKRGHAVFTQARVSQGHVGHSDTDIAFLRVILAGKSTGKKFFNNCFWLDITSQSCITKLRSF